MIINLNRLLTYINLVINNANLTYIPIYVQN